jgi:hypothetical protein
MSSEGAELLKDLGIVIYKASKNPMSLSAYKFLREKLLEFSGNIQIDEQKQEIKNLVSSILKMLKILPLEYNLQLILKENGSLKDCKEFTAFLRKNGQKIKANKVEKFCEKMESKTSELMKRRGKEYQKAKEDLVEELNKRLEKEQKKVVDSLRRDLGNLLNNRIKKKIEEEKLRQLRKAKGERTVDDELVRLREEKERLQKRNRTKVDHELPKVNQPRIKDSRLTALKILAKEAKDKEIRGELIKFPPLRNSTKKGIHSLTAYIWPVKDYKGSDTSEKIKIDNINSIKYWIGLIDKTKKSTQNYKDENHILFNFNEFENELEKLKLRFYIHYLNEKDWFYENKDRKSKRLNFDKIIKKKGQFKIEDHYDFEEYLAKTKKDQRPNMDNNFNFEKDPVFAEKISIPRNAEVIIFGDFHSSFHSLLRSFEKLNYIFETDTMKLKKNYYVIFTGDLVDRGAYGLEILLFVFKLKNENFDQVYIINGNHEDLSSYKHYGLGEEIHYQFPYKNRPIGYKEVKPAIKEGKLDENDPYTKLAKCMYYFPSVIYMYYNGHIYHLSHGAFDPFYADPNTELSRFLENENYRFLLVENYNPGNQFKWGDFDETIKEENYKKGYHDEDYKKGYFLDTENTINRSGRGQFGLKIVENYLKNNGLKCIIGGHQDYCNLSLMIKSSHKDIKKIGFSKPIAEMKGNEFTIQNNRRQELKLKYRTDSDKIIFIDGSKFEYRACTYNLFTLAKQKQSFFHTDEEKYKDVSVSLKPGEDFVALVTSSAIIPRKSYMYSDAYLILKTES